MKTGDAALAAGGLGALALGGYVVWRRLGPAGTPATVTPTGTAGPGPNSGSPSTAQPMTLALLLQYPVGHIPVSDAVAWVPAQNAARLMQAQGGGYGLFDLSHHPVGYTFPDGQQHIAAQNAAAYLWDLGVDPCPPALYADLQAASQATGVPLPLLLGVAHTESTFLAGGLVTNGVCTPGSCTVGHTAGPGNGGGPVGLMQVSLVACQQVGVSYAAATSSPASNALAGAKYLAYLAGLHHVPVASTDYALWAPVLVAYGEGTAATSTMANAGNGGWVAQHTPAAAAVAQQATSRAAAPAAYQAPAPVTCTTATAHLSTAAGVQTVTSRVCSNGSRTVQRIS